MSNDDLINLWRRIVKGGEKSWALFEHGTCVILMNPEKDLPKQAINILSENGTVHAGSVSGDFQTMQTDVAPGWVVVYDAHPDILNYVSPEEMGEENREVVAGLKGREKRDQDSKELKVIHVEDKR